MYVCPAREVSFQFLTWNSYLPREAWIGVAGLRNAWGVSRPVPLMSESRPVPLLNENEQIEN